MKVCIQAFIGLTFPPSDRAGSSPFVGCVRPGNFKARDQKGTLNRGFADGEDARGDRQEFDLRFSFLFPGQKKRLILLKFGNLNPLGEDLLDSFFQLALQFQLSGFILFLLLSVPE